MRNGTLKRAARTRSGQRGTGMGRAGAFAAALGSRYGRGSRQPGQLRLVLAEPLEIHLRRTTRHNHWSQSLNLQVNLPVTAKMLRAATVDKGRSIAGPATVAVRVERTLDRLRIILAQAADRYSRRRLHAPAARILPPLRQELVRPALVAAEAKRA